MKMNASALKHARRPCQQMILSDVLLLYTHAYDYDAAFTFNAQSAQSDFTPNEFYLLHTGGNSHHENAPLLIRNHATVSNTLVCSSAKYYKNKHYAASCRGKCNTLPTAGQMLRIICNQL